VVFAHAYAARVLEAQSRFDEALVEYQHALGAWDDHYGEGGYYSMYVIPLVSKDDLSDDATRVKKTSLAPIINRLQQSTDRPGGTLVARGRWLIENGHFADALKPLTQATARYQASPAALEARVLMHRARLLSALELIGRDAATVRMSAAGADLTHLCAEPLDFAMTAACIARATLLWQRGSQMEATARLTEALTRGAAQPAQPVAAETPLARDVADIYQLLFRTKGDGVFGGSARDGIPSVPLPFMLTSANVEVKTPDGDVVHLPVPRTSMAPQRVLYISSEDWQLLHAVMDKLGGTQKREPTLATEVPNQPIGGTLGILDFWSHLFSARPGHWGGWDFETYPAVTQIAFEPHDAKKAYASVVFGYSGVTVVLEKEGGVWSAKRLINQWVE
jgi:hypothetical protein